MITLIYRCPTTGLKVQGMVEKREISSADEFVSLKCAACGRMHFVNPTTGRVLGAADQSEE
jgi:hypothetical protein